jgi:MSHA biogenesis protein MshM
MYLQHFALTEPPFGLTPDTSYFMNRAGYQDALNVLLVALRGGEGFIKVVGEVGTGKTLLCRKLINTLGGDFRVAYIHNPYLNPDSLLLAIAHELLIPLPGDTGPHELMDRITRALLAFHAEGRRVVVCLDEAQAMPVATLETLRLLTNLETEKRKLLQVVLFGQPELDRLLEQPSVRQLRQRITFSYNLLPMNRVALAAYVQHRLRVAGYAEESLFTCSAMELLHMASRGIPRLINIICHKGLMLAYGRGETTVSRDLLERAVRDTLDAQRSESRRMLFGRLALLRWAYSVLGLLALFAFGVLLGVVT